jgi:hypothetical protein
MIAISTTSQNGEYKNNGSYYWIIQPKDDYILNEWIKINETLANELYDPIFYYM